MNFQYLFHDSDLNYAAMFVVIAAYIALMAAFLIPT